jgi:putative phosphoribosyl transferase
MTMDMRDKLSNQYAYRDRIDAGQKLAGLLKSYVGKDALILAIPRGGVPVAAEVARELKAELDVVVARKLGAPMQPELAIGAVTANGGLFLDEDALVEIGVSKDYLEQEIARETEVARQREARFRNGRHPARVEGRTVIVVDDGLATGATMRAAVRSVAKRQPAKLVVAVPAGAREATIALRRETDEVVCPLTPEPFYAVGLYYADFAPVEDEEVEAILEQARSAALRMVAAVSKS